MRLHDKKKTKDNKKKKKTNQVLGCGAMKVQVFKIFFLVI